MKTQKLLIALFLLLMLPTAPIFANEINQSFGDRSWQFKTPSDKLIDNQRLVLRCQTDPDSCPKGFIGGAGGSGGSGGQGLANGTAIGNITNVTITGSNNQVNTTQTNTDSDQTVDQNVTDNVLDIDSNTQVLNGDVNDGGTVDSHNTSSGTSTFDVQYHSQDTPFSGSD